MNKLKNFFKIGFYSSNIILIILYLYPGSILGCFLYNDCNFDPQITRDFFISSNHLYAFIILSTLGILAYRDNSKINIIILYLFPGSILGLFLHNNHQIQPQITRDFIISTNHVYAFILLTSLGVLSFHNTKKINFLIVYLFLLSIILELSHIIIPNRGFEMNDLFGNIVGVILVILTYKIIIRYAKT